jgi:SAM-dependent methyltransferase
MTLQSEGWKGEVGEAWARGAEALDPLLAHFGSAAIDVLQPKVGERILDVGCGAGWTSRELAQRVASRGEVTGIDISPALLAIARSRGGNVRYLEQDAATASFDNVFDAVFSRFGVMFFDDPRTAFANLRRAAPRGRLAFICWRSASDNPAMTYPTAIAKHLLPEPAPANPDAPGPFAFADRAKVERLLRDSGWRAVAVKPHDSQYTLGPTAEAAVDMVLNIGPLARAVRDAPGTEQAVRAAVHEAFTKLAPSGPVALPAATWIVTAHA